MTEVERTGQGDADVALPDHVRQRVRDSVADNTRRGYRHDWARFAAWCDKQSRTPLPATGATLAAYVSHLADEDKAPATIDRAISCVRTMHRVNGHAEQPATEEARAVLRWHRQQRAEHGKRNQKKATPAIVDALRAMIATCDPYTLAGKRNRALLMLGFAMMARRSELSNLDIGDLRETNDGLEVHIRRSKTDRDAAGADVAVPYGTHPDTCPVRTVRVWVEALAELGATSGPLFRPIDRHGRLGSDPNAAGYRSPRLSGTSVDAIVQRTARRAGLPNAGGYSAHSLRAGGATAAYKGGADVSTIAKHGRWNEKSPVVLGYIRAVDRWKDNPMRGVGL